VRALTRLLIRPPPSSRQLPIQANQPLQQTPIRLVRRPNLRPRLPAPIHSVECLPIRLPPPLVLIPSVLRLTPVRPPPSIPLVRLPIPQRRLPAQTHLALPRRRPLLLPVPIHSEGCPPIRLPPPLVLIPSVPRLTPVRPPPSTP